MPPPTALLPSPGTARPDWSRKAVISAFEFLDKQVADGEWSLRFDQLHFATGKVFLQWQVDTSSKIELSQVTQ